MGPRRNNMLSTSAALFFVTGQLEMIISPRRGTTKGLLLVSLSVNTPSTSCTFLRPGHVTRHSWDSLLGSVAPGLVRSTWFLSGKLVAFIHLMTSRLTVQASYNQTLSEESNKVTFCPQSDTIIGPPNVSLAGGDKCIQVNMSLPEADSSSRIKDIKKFYPGSQFKVYWRIGQTGAVMSALTPNKTYTVKNLQVGTEYCVQVHTQININRNTKASAWNCIFTSIVEPGRDAVFLGTVAALLVVFGVLMSSPFLLYYSGFICQVKSLPTVLNEVLSHSSTLTPERIIYDKISIVAETEKPKRQHNPPAQQTATRGTDSYDEDEEEEVDNVYMDRDAELSSGQSSCQDSVDVSGNSKLPGVFGRHGELDQNEAKAEGTEVCFMTEGPVTGKVKEDDEEMEDDKKEEEEVAVVEEVEEEMVCESFGNINLFSVTLAALAVCEEERGEQNRRESLSDFVKLSDLEPLLPPKSKQTLNHTDSLSESDDRTTVALMSALQEDFTEDGHEASRITTLSGCLSTCDGETEEDEEEDEEEEFSGYMRHA